MINDSMLDSLMWTDKKKEWIISAAFLLVALISTGAFFLYDHSNQKEYLEERVYGVERAHERAYSSLYLFTKQLSSIYSQQLLDERLNRWLRNPGELKEDMYELSFVQKSFIGLIQSHTGLESIYLYNQKIDRILSTSFMISSLEQFPHREVFEEYYASGASSVTVTTSSDRNPRIKDEQLSFVFGIPSRSPMQGGVISFNYDLGYIKEAVLGNSHSFIWVDETDDIIITDSEEHRLFYEEHRKALITTQQTSFHVKDHHVIRSESPDGSWKLLTIIPLEELYGNRQNSMTQLGFVVSLSLLAALMPHIYFYIAKRRRERWFRTKVQSNLVDMQKGFIHDLLSGKPLHDMHEKAQEYLIDLNSDVYQVIVFEIDDYYHHLIDKSHQEKLLMNKVIFNAIHWTFKLRFTTTYTLNAEYAKIAVLIGYEDTAAGSSDGSALPRADEQDLTTAVRYIQQDIHEQFGLTVCAGVSMPVREVSQIHEAYVHALSALEYKSVYGKGSMILYSQVPNGASASEVGSMYEYSDKLASYLHKGDVNAIEQLLDGLIRSWIAGGTSAVSGLHAWFGNLLFSLMKFALEQRIDLNKHLKEDVFFRLYSYEFIEDKKRYLLEICRFIVSEVHTDHSRKNETAEWIIEYIGKNYDKPLSLSILADKISMSPSYLSALIKSHLGVGFVEYVSQLRIQKAVRLLEDDSLTVQDIAEQCGYDTIHTFIRQFKKTHRMPPNEYRKIRRRELGQQEIL